MGEELNISEAKGLYTFTATEKIQFRYAVVASNWDEAKEEIAQGNTMRLAAGDHAGGEYMGESEPRREILLRKATCIIDKLTLKREAYKDEEGDYLYYNPDHSEMLLYKPSDGGSWGFNLDEDYGCSFDVVAVNEKGICSHCERMIEDRDWEIALEQQYGKGDSEVVYSRHHGFKTEENMKAAKIQKGIDDHTQRLTSARLNPHSYNPDGSSLKGGLRDDGRVLRNVRKQPEFGHCFSNVWMAVECVAIPEPCEDRCYCQTSDMKWLEVYDQETGSWSPYKGDA